jgi:hypothetical protein
VSFPLRCQVCSVLIGVYDPLMVRGGGIVRETSRAFEPELSPIAGEHYHSACYRAELEDYAISEDL